MECNNQEFEYTGLKLNGFMMLGVCALLIPGIILWVCLNMPENQAALITALLAVTDAVMFSGFFIQEPNESRVVLFFGKYRGTCRTTGYVWINPFMSTRKLSLRIRNMDIKPIKVNDKTGNPVLIGMVLVWKIKDTYRATFDIDSQSLGGTKPSVSSVALENFVRIQSDAALREVTGHFAYDDSGISAHEPTLRSSGDEINRLLENKINERLSMAGMEVVEARLNYLAYAPEIAAVMLRRQQATAIISAREQIVEGAVSMVKMALNRINGEGIVSLTEEQKARMVGNLLVVLCADEQAQPIVSADE